MTEATFELPEKGEARSSADGKVKTGLSKLKEVVNGKLGQGNFETNAAVAGKWYTPSVIATEQTRESASFGTLSTPDEITGVVVPTNGLVRVRIAVSMKSSTASAGKVALFFGATQAETMSTLEGSTANTEFARFTTTGNNGGTILNQNTPSAFPTTGFGLTPLDFFLAAGTYTVSLKFKATTGSVTAKERKLYVEVLGS